MIGIIKTINHDKGFGFLRNGELPQDVYFHKSVCDDFDALLNGDSIEFDYSANQKGFVATSVKVTKTCEKLVPFNGVVMVRTGTPKGIRSLSGSKTLKSGWFRSPDDARNNLKSKAVNAGCNVITFLDCEKKVETVNFSTGYKGTFHRFTGQVLVGAKSELISYDPNVIEENEKLKRLARQKVDELHLEPKEKKKPKDPHNWLYFTLLTFIGLVFAVIYLEILFDIL